MLCVPKEKEYNANLKLIQAEAELDFEKKKNESVAQENLVLREKMRTMYTESRQQLFPRAASPLPSTTALGNLSPSKLHNSSPMSVLPVGNTSVIRATVLLRS